MTRKILFSLAIAVLLTSAGCSSVRNFSLKPYRINIQQGNYLEEREVDEIQPGMTRSQVHFLLGTPMVVDLFDANRWDYVYYLKIGRTGAIYRRHFVITFEGDLAVGVEKPNTGNPLSSG